MIDDGKVREDITISNTELWLDISDINYTSEIIITTWSSLIIDVSSLSNLVEDYSLFTELGNINLYDIVYSYEWFEVEAPYQIIIDDIVYVSEDINRLLISNISIFDAISYSEYSKALLPGGKEIFESIYINNIVIKNIEIPSNDLIISLSVNSISKQMIEIKDANS